MTTKTKTKWSDQAYKPDEVDGERMLALSGRILKRMLKAGKIWRDVDHDDTARELAKPGQWKWNPQRGSDLSDLKRAFDDRKLPDWMAEPAREAFDEMVSQYEQGCFVKPYDLNVARVIVACEQLDNDCASIGRDHTNGEVAEIFAQFAAVTSEAMPVLIPDTWLGELLLGPSLTAEELV